MYIQTDQNGRIVAMMEKTFIDDEGNEVEQDTTGYFEFEFPEDFDMANFNEYLLLDGELVYSMSEWTRFYKIENLKAQLAETDYISAKMNDAIMSCTTVEEILQVNKGFNEKYRDILAERQALRDEINRLIEAGQR